MAAAVQQSTSSNDGTMNDSGTFLCFPLCLLALDKPEKERLQVIISHALHRVGASRAWVDAAAVIGYVAARKGIGFQSHNELHMRLVHGAIVLNVEIEDLSGCANCCEEATQFASNLELRYGRSPLVFIASRLFWGCHNNGRPSYRDFSTLCAVNSVTGFKKTPVLIRRVMVTARQLGYKTPAVMMAELPHRKDQRPMSTGELRGTLDRLECTELLSRCQASPRNVYFSTTLSPEELRKQVEGIVTRKGKVQLRRELDRAAMQPRTRPEPLKNELGEEEPLKNGGPLKNGELGCSHNGTTPATTAGTTKRNALKEVSLKKGTEIREGTLFSRSPSDGEDARWQLSAEAKFGWEAMKQQLGMPPQPETEPEAHPSEKREP